MPEGHTVHRMAIDHTKWFADQIVNVSSPQGRFSEEAGELDGDTFLRADAHGKHLFHHWSSGKITHIHLGLYGKFRLQKNPAAAPRGAVRMRLVGHDRTLDLNGPNQCELLNEIRSPAAVTATWRGPITRRCGSRAGMGAIPTQSCRNRHGLA